METNAGIHPYAPSPQSGAAPAEFTATEIAQDPILHFFHYAHLPVKLGATSKPFFELARVLVTTLPRNAERTVALRKLLEAKDCAVRANLPGQRFEGPARHAVIGDAPLGEPREIGGHDEDRDGPVQFRG